MIRYREDRMDLFTVPEDYYLCHCISSDFGMGAGIVVMFNKLFDMKNKMLTLHADEGTPKWDQVKTGYIIPEGRVINLITKRLVWQKPTYDALKDALIEMREYLAKNDIHKLAMPLIGCGIDGLEWGVVRNIVLDVFWESDIEILVCVWP